MNQIYRVIVRGQVLESANLRKLMARAVADKRAMDHRFRLFLDREFRPLTSLCDRRDLQTGGGTDR
jgi:hypothetical protein